MMKRLALLALAACLTLGAAADAVPRRVVSLIPATTEMIFAMGAGSRLIAVSSYDKYPPEATKLPRVGALLDPDTERILSLHPDLVIVYGTQTELKRSLDRATIPYYSYEHRAMPDIMATIRAVGARIGYARPGQRPGIVHGTGVGRSAGGGGRTTKTADPAGVRARPDDAAEHLRQRRLRLSRRPARRRRRRQHLRRRQAAVRSGRARNRFWRGGRT